MLILLLSAAANHCCTIFAMNSSPLSLFKVFGAPCCSKARRYHSRTSLAFNARSAPNT